MPKTLHGTLPPSCPSALEHELYLLLLYHSREEQLVVEDLAELLGYLLSVAALQ